MDEACGRDLLQVPMAWPLSGRIVGRQRFSTRRLPLHDQLSRIDAFAVFVPHDFRADRLSETVQGRSKFEETYARPIRPKTDNELPGDVLEAIQHEHMPQYTLRNIGRYEMAVDLDDPLPFRREAGLGGSFGVELDEVRNAHIPEPQLAEIWSVAYVRRLRESTRRLVLEDPWEYRFGQEATSVFDGPRQKFIVDGTHPDDLPGADWAPTPIPMPAQWLSPPPGEAPMERPTNLVEEVAKLNK
ncbi:MAG: hypothetical protein ACOYOB_01260 [Myxococcota bacterium]